ncbi:MAG TPA: acyltransferase family protein [Polyangiaceae bacterium]
MNGASAKPRIPHLHGLDGLRGLALLGVLLFHADGALPGGYLGVDLFFVLSGYLITSLLLREFSDTGRIDLYGFWVRRCRRLFPALLSLMPMIAIYGRFFARSEDLQALRNEAFASLAYVANWHAIFSERSYWQLFAAPSPLEHTWSLAIEEQFYVVWPLLAAFLLKRGGARAMLVLSLLLSLLSVGAMLVLFSPADTSRVYLGTDTRMVAVLLGSALATLLPPGTSWSAARVKLLDMAGVIAGCGLAVAWVWLRGTDTFLYRGGLWLTELAVLVLIACAVMGRQSLVARALSFRPLRMLGTISYGVYLWHWPINVLLNAERLQLHGLPLQVLRFTVTFAIAGISYRFLEAPIRRHGVPFLRAHFALPAAVAVAVMLVVRSTDARAGVAADARVQGRLLASSALAPHLTRYRVVVFGDSTANSIGWGLRALHASGMQVDLLGKDGCSMVGGSSDGERWAERTRELRADAALVYLGGAFLHGFSVEGSWHAACHADWDLQLEQAVTKRLRELELTQSRVFTATVPYALGHWDTAEYRARIDCINGALRKAVAAVPSVRLLDVQEQLCPLGICTKDLPDGGAIRPDGVHFSIDGARRTAAWLLDKMRH